MRKWRSWGWGGGGGVRKRGEELEGGLGGGERSWGGGGVRKRRSWGWEEAKVCVGTSSHVVIMCSSDVPQVGLSLIRSLS